MADHLLVLGGSRQAEAGLKHLKSLGLKLTVCDINPMAPGFVHADHKIIASVYHVEDCLPAVEKFCETETLNGVMCLACDVPHVVARIADRLRLPGISIETADRAVHKMDMKRKFEVDGVSVPRYWAVKSASDVADILEELNCELVVKPVDSRGSKGVSRLAVDGDVDWAFNNASVNSPSKQVMVEEYLAGPQVSTETVIVDGKAVTPALSDRSYEFLDKFHPFIVEDGGDMPTILPQTIVQEICELVELAAASLGVVNGIVKGDIVVNNGKPYVIELAARLSGGYFCTHQIPFSTGVNLVEACALIALGKQLNLEDWQAKKHRYVSTRWKLIKPGRVIAVPSVDPVFQSEGVLAFEHWLKVGDVVGEAENAAASVAMVQAEGASQREARIRAVEALKFFEPTVEVIENIS
ncbi:MAG: ATP-grasp domain-containing protein [Kordiimonas sp.]